MVFNDDVNYGSKQHFFHLLLGYLLPSIHTIYGIEQVAKRTLFLFESSGPVMDVVVTDLLHSLQLDHLILSKKAFRQSAYDELTIPRWDIHLLSNYIIEESAYKISPAAVFFEHAELMTTIRKKDFYSSFKQAMIGLRETILNKMAVDQNKDGPRPMLFIKRSPAPFYYSSQGASESNYGTTRRALLDVDDAANYVTSKGILALGYEPGAESITEQIRRFFRSRGMVGIRGAEFANAFWMNPGSTVVLIKPPKMNTPPVQQGLCEVMGLKYIEINSHEGQFPSLLKIDLLSYL